MYMISKVCMSVNYISIGDLGPIPYYISENSLGLVPFVLSWKQVVFGPQKLEISHIFHFYDLVLDCGVIISNFHIRDSTPMGMYNL